MKTKTFVVAGAALFALGRRARDVGSMHVGNRCSCQEPVRQGCGRWPYRRSIGSDPLSRDPGANQHPPTAAMSSGDARSGDVFRRRTSANNGPATRGAAGNTRPTSTDRGHGRSHPRPDGPGNDGSASPDCNDERSHPIPGSTSSRWGC